MATVYIGIGSNLGEREENCRRAIALLIKEGMKVTRLSSMIETEPWGVSNQPEFINVAIKAETVLNPHELLSLLKKVESEMGRVPGIRWGPRIIDLDILLYDDLAMKTYEIEIPHPGISERDFVLKPLAEIAPDTIHPLLKKSMAALLNDISG